MSRTSLRTSLQCIVDRRDQTADLDRRSDAPPRDVWAGDGAGVPIQRDVHHPDHFLHPHRPVIVAIPDANALAGTKRNDIEGDDAVLAAPSVQTDLVRAV